MENNGTPIGLDDDSRKTGYRGKDCNSCFSLEGLAGAVGTECTVRNGGMRCSDGAGGFDGFDGVDGGFDGVGGGFDGFGGVDGGFDGVDEGGSDGSDSLPEMEKLRELSFRNMHGWEATIGDIVR